MIRFPIQLDSLELFAEAGRLRSFKLAGESLSVSSSAISQAIHKLEAQIGCALFVRKGNALELTADGTTLLRYVENGLKEIGAGLQAIATPAKRPLSLSSPPALASQLLPVVLKELTAVGLFDIHMVSDENPNFVSYKEFDVAVLYGAQAARLPGLQSLGPDVFTPACIPTIASSIRELKDMTKYPLLCNDTSSVTWDDWLHLNGIPPRGIRYMRFNRGLQIIEAMRDGLGIGLESLRVIARPLERGEVTTVVVDGLRTISRDLTFLHISPENARSKEILLLAELVKKQCETLLDGRRRVTDRAVARKPSLRINKRSSGKV